MPAKQPSSQAASSSWQLIYAIPLSSAARTPTIFRPFAFLSFCRSSHWISRRRELRRTRRTDEKDSPPRLLSHSYVYIFRARVCKLLYVVYRPGGGLLLIGLLTLCSLRSRRREKEKEKQRDRGRDVVRVFLACTIHCSFACNLRVRASENRGNFYQPHLIIAAKTFLLSSSLLAHLFISHLFASRLRHRNIWICDMKRLACFNNVYI